MHAFEAVASRWAVDSAQCLYKNAFMIYKVQSIDFNSVLLTDSTN